MKRKRLSTLIALLLCALGTLKAQDFIYTYSTTGIYTTGPTDVVKIVESHDHGYITLSYGVNPAGNTITLISKFTKNGQKLWVTSLQITPPPGQNSIVRGLAMAENETTASNDIAVGGYLQEQTGGTARGFLVVLNSGGGILWQRKWDGGEVRSLTFNANPTVPTNYQIAVLTHEFNPGSGQVNMVVSVYPQGGPPPVTSIALTDLAIHQGVDIVNMPSLNSYGVVGNRLNPGGTPHIILYKVAYGLTAVSGSTININPPSPPSTYATRLLFDDVVSGGQNLYVCGYRNNGTDSRPIAIKANASTLAVSNYNVVSLSLPPGVDMFASGLCMVKKTGQTGVLISGYKKTGALYEPQTYYANLSLSIQKINSYVYPNSRFSDVTSTFDPMMQMVGGFDAMSNIVLSRLEPDGGILPCSSFQTSGDEGFTYNQTPQSMYNAYSYTVLPLTLIQPPFSLSPIAQCGCTPGTGKTYYNKAIKMGSYTFGSWNKNQTDFNTLNNDVAYGITAIDAGVNKAMLTTVALNGVYNFGKVYHTDSSTHQVRSVKKLLNGDYALAGIATKTANSRQYIFIIRTDGNGNLIWYKRLMTLTTCGGCGSPTYECEIGDDIYFNHVYITETKGNQDLVVAADFIYDEDSRGDYTVARVSSDGNTLRYYRNHRPKKAVKSNNVRYNIELNGITSTSDNGYAVCGSAGNNFKDWNGSIVIKFDASWASGGNVMNWYKIFRGSMSNYYLDDTTRSVYTVANDIKEDASGNLVVVGYINNMNAYFNGETYTSGLLLRYSSSGTLNARRKFNSTVAEMVFNGITVTSTGEYAVTGKWGAIFQHAHYSGSTTYRAIMLKIDPTAFSSTGRIYGTFSTSNRNELNCAFEQSNGFTLTGLTNDFSSTLLPSLYSVASNTSFACESANLGPTGVDTVNNDTVFNWNSYYTGRLMPDITHQVEVCLDLEDLCSSSSLVKQDDGKVDRVFGKSIQNTEQPVETPTNENSVVIYPNPTNNRITVEILQTENAKGSVDIYDIQGKLIASKKVDFVKGINTAQMNVSELSSGVYLLQVKDSNSTVITSQKFIKE